MFQTDQFRVFPDAPVDRVLSRPRRLLQEGRLAEAETAYRTVLGSRPELQQAWFETFELFRHAQRYEDALSLAHEAAAQLPEAALPRALEGAALVELGRVREGLTALDDAAQRDPDLGLVWHEAGYAAFRLGELSRALMALDRAFALEPHGRTMFLRGRVLRQAGRYLAAEVAFEGAAEAAEFPAQRAAAEREVAVTRRYAAYPGRRPETLPPARRYFAETGAIALTGSSGEASADDAVAAALLRMALEEGWKFSVVVALDAWPGWYDLARGLEIPVAAEVPESSGGIPLIVARHPGNLPRWRELADLPARLGRGASFALHQPADAPTADLVGFVDGLPAGAIDPALAVETAQHPESRLAHRKMC